MAEKQGITLTKTKLVILILIVLLLIGGGIVVGLNWQSWFGGNPQTPVSTSTLSPDLDPNASDWVGQQLENQSGGESTGIQIPGYPSITLPADTQDVSVALLNPEGNPCYFRFELVLKDSGESLYQSGLVAPGQAIYHITLSRPLSAGEYDAVIRITTSSLEDLSPMNGANVETLLLVE